MPEAAGVEFTGVIGDPELDTVLARARVGLAPLSFGAGMKRKTLHYLSHGLPVVGTAFAVQGLADEGGGVVPGVVRCGDGGRVRAGARSARG